LFVRFPLWAALGDGGADWSGEGWFFWKMGLQGSREKLLGKLGGPKEHLVGKIHHPNPITIFNSIFCIPKKISK
jgi:hypothetical protein